ncbi:MAG: GNAT family N-acetyltransferase [Deltaproteobacteria bacterium]|nr:GNAT family N-acetyltransferase [Deltaproteobacteria bacterium]
MNEKQIETQQGVFRVRPYQSHDEAGVLSLWRAAFGKDISSPLWRWKYLENPYPIQIGVTVADNGRIMVMYGGIPYRVNWMGTEVSMTHLMDIMSHPDCRGSGLFVNSGLAFFDLFAGPERTLFYYGFPGKYHFDIGKKYLDYQPLNGGVCFLVAKAGEMTPKIGRLSNRIERIKHVDGAFDALWNECRRYYPFSVIRDSAFIHWRFFEHPLKSYELWGYGSRFRKGVSAYAVFSLDEGKARMVDICAPSSEGLVTDFLGRLGKHFHERGIDEIEAWLPQRHFLARFSVSAGFNRVKEPLGFVPTGRSFHPDLSVAWASKNLFYTMADGDLL